MITNYIVIVSFYSSLDSIYCARVKESLLSNKNKYGTLSLENVKYYTISIHYNNLSQLNVRKKALNK